MRIKRHLLGAIVAFCCFAGQQLHAQGPLDPPGAPEPTMKTLQQLWDKQAAQQAQINAALQQSAVALNALNVELPWIITTVESTGNVGSFTSLAFGPDGQPAISHYDAENGELEFARFNGSSWTTQTVESVGSLGRDTSLAFGPDGQPAISYHDDTDNDLKFARRGVFPPAP
jgi:hypothetical protein